MKYLVLFSIWLAPGLILAGDFTNLAKQLYPTNNDDQAFLNKFFEIVELHKTNDPLLEQSGPSIASYSLDKMRFAFAINETESTVDLALFNWTLPLFEGLESDNVLSTLYGSKVYTLKKINKLSLASQGENNDEFSNFSYLYGANTMEAYFKLGAPPDYKTPAEFLDWKPHPNYMKRDHPLRLALGVNTLTILSPSKKYILEDMGAATPTELSFEEAGGFFNMIMGMMIHEMYHVKESEDAVNKFVVSRDIPEERKSIVEKLRVNKEVRSLFALYAKIVFSLGDSLKSPTLSLSEQQILGDLLSVINTLKTKYPGEWSFIWSYEYTEGFAEYVSAYSMIQSNVTPLPIQIDLQKNDSSNNFAYRTGAIGGLYLANRIQKMPFENKKDHSHSVWEIILQQMKVTQIGDVQKIMEKYKAVPFNENAEIESIIDYLISTVEE